MPYQGVPFPVPESTQAAVPSPASSARDSLLAEFVAAKQALRLAHGAETFASWLEPLALRRVDGDCAVLELPSRFMADWVKTHFGRSIETALTARIPGIAHVRIEAGQPPHPAGAPAPAADCSSGDRNAGDRNAAGADPIGVPSFEPRYSFDQFVTGKANELAFNASQTLANAVGQGQSAGFNPLFLHGPTGLGKTHLMHAIGQSVMARLPGARVVYLSAERFMVEFLAALRERETIRFKQRLRSADLLMIDDVQFIAGKDSTQEEFFHTMNEIIGAGGWLVISADRSPQNLEGIESRIQSRLAWGLVADINPADYELRLNILKAKVAAIPGARVPDAVIEFLARRIVANVRELEGALNRVIAYANLTGRAVDVDFAREVLADLLRAHTRKLTIDDIQRRVAEHYRLKLHDLVSPRRAREVARPRQVAMYLAKQLTPRSLPEIGRRFGGRDHTTVMHAVKRIEELRAQDHELDRDIQHLKRVLDG
jgi:chromosomal replication initiator protein